MIVDFHGIECRLTTYRTNGENKKILTLVNTEDWKKSLDYDFVEPQNGLWCRFLTNDEVSEIYKNYYIEKIKAVGYAKGDCEELRDFSQKAYEDYKAGIISEAAYGKIYAVCVDYAYPR